MGDGLDSGAGQTGRGGTAGAGQGGTGLGLGGWLLLQLLRVLPKNAMSRVAGRLAGVRWPFGLGPLFVRGFARLAGADLDEVRAPMSSFRSIQSFFVRELVPGARPIDPAPAALVSPCDGAWGQSGRIEHGTLLQVKGRPYALADLLASSERARSFEGGQFATLYLSPRDYHRFHAPCDAEVERVDYVPGRLWPVNRIGLEGVPGLFAENERLCVHLAPRDAAGRSRAGAASICVVAVGATMVGKTKLTFSSLETNVWGGAGTACVYEHGEATLARGEEMGRFEFGSTLVMLVPAGGVRLELREPGTSLRVGERIGGFTAAED